MERRFTFDAVADLYEAVRPGYPAVLVDQIWSTARLAAGDPVLELGCGTGKATRLFAERGVHVVALDPGANLLGVARRALADFPNIDFVATTFEDWPLEPGDFKLVFAAQSFHWIAPEIQFSKAAEALAPGGVLAVFGNTVMPLDPPLQEQIDRIYARVAPTLIDKGFAGAWYLEGGGLSRLFETVPAPLGTPMHHGYAWSRNYTAADFADYLCTQSSHQLLPTAQREDLLSEIGNAILARGGVVELRFECHLYMAVRRA
jgi:SAM-dependent methyltransferase